MIDWKVGLAYTDTEKLKKSQLNLPPKKESRDVSRTKIARCQARV